MKPIPAWKEALLWLSVLPVAFLGLVIASLVAQLAMWLSSSINGDETWLFLLLKMVVIYGAGSAAFVYAGCAMAPRWKMPIATFLAGIVTALSLIGLVLNVMNKQWLPAWSYVCSITGTVMVWMSLLEGQPEPVDLLFWRKRS